jgi:hypothetical protein
MTNCAVAVDYYWKQQALKETARSRPTAGKKLPEEAKTRVAGEPSEVGSKKETEMMFLGRCLLNI